MAKSQKTKLCKHCKTEIPAGAKVCPNCNKKTSNTLKWVAIGFIVLFFIGAINGLSNTTPSSNTTNVLMATKVKTVDVMNGLGDTVLGQRAYVEISDKDFTSLTLDDFQEFANNVVKDSGYRYVTIISDSGKAIFFPGSDIHIIQYGNIGEDGLLSETLGDIILQDDGSTYLYQPR